MKTTMLLGYYPRQLGLVTTAALTASLALLSFQAGSKHMSAVERVSTNPGCQSDRSDLMLNDA
jgi:hypothetical protein